MIRRGEDLRFIWKDYDPLSMPFIENWLDEYAVKMAPVGEWMEKQQLDHIFII